MLNWFILAYLVVSVACMLALLYVMRLQLREVRRPKDGFTKLRWHLFWLPTIIFFGLALGLPQLIHSLHLPYAISQAIRIIGGIVVLGGYTLLTLGTYTYREKR